MAAAGGGPRFSAPPSPAFLFPAAALAPGEGFRAARAPLREPPRFRPPPAQSLVPVGPAAPAPARSGPAAAPITSAAGPAPTFGGPWARAGRPSSRSARPGERSAASSRAGLRGHSVPRPGPRWGPSPAATAAPGGGGGMEPPPPPPLPPRSPAEGREGSAPRQDPPLRPPPATSTPSLAPSQAPRALPLNGSESAKEGETGKYPPALWGAAAAAAGAARRGARSRRRHGAPSPARPHGGGAGAAGAERRRGLRPPGPSPPGPARRGLARPRSRGVRAGLGKTGTPNSSQLPPPRAPAGCWLRFWATPPPPPADLEGPSKG